jgi:hypothetical protein
VEIVLRVWAKKAYICVGVFWMDFLSTFAVMLDITLFTDGLIFYDHEQYLNGSTIALTDQESLLKFFYVISMLKLLRLLRVPLGHQSQKSIIEQLASFQNKDLIKSSENETKAGNLTITNYKYNTISPGGNKIPSDRILGKNSWPVQGDNEMPDSKPNHETSNKSKFKLISFTSGNNLPPAIYVSQRTCKLSREANNRQGLQDRNNMGF